MGALEPLLLGKTHAGRFSPNTRHSVVHHTYGMIVWVGYIPYPAFNIYIYIYRQLMILWTVQIVVQDWKLCPQKHAKLLWTPWASLT